MRRAVLAAYRVRGPLYRLAAVVLIGHFALSLALTDGVPGAVGGPLVVAALLAFALSVALTFLAPRLLPRNVPEQVVAAPVRGRWTALNSPATTVPSHGVRAYGQAYAIDLVHEPEPGARPEFGTGRAMRPAEEYPALGEPVHAMIDGVVVRVRQGRRDHRARSSLLGFAYLMVESAVREIGGVGNILGNHVTVRGDDGVFATVAHLQRGSARVRVGQRVSADEVVGRCGNSGNSSEPHVHAQLMDRESPVLAQGLPMAFGDVALGDDPTPVAGLPANGEAMIAAERPRSTP